MLPVTCAIAMSNFPSFTNKNTGDALVSMPKTT